MFTIIPESNRRVAYVSPFHVYYTLDGSLIPGQGQQAVKLITNLPDKNLLPIKSSAVDYARFAYSA